MAIVYAAAQTMNPHPRSVVLAAAILVALAVWWLWPARRQTGAVTEDVSLAQTQGAGARATTPETRDETREPTTGAPRRRGLTIRLIGRCVDSKTRSGVGDLELVLSSRADVRRVETLRLIETPQEARARSGPDGRFAFSLEPRRASTTKLEIESETHAPLVATWKQLEPDENGTVDAGDIVLTRGGRLRGSVVDGDDVGVPFAEVAFFRVVVRAHQGVIWRPERSSVKPPIRQSTVTDAHGAFEGPLLAPGRWRAYVSNPGGFGGQRELTLEAGETRDVTLRLDNLTGTGVISGVVVDEDGAPVVGARVTTVPPTRMPWGVASDERGRFFVARAGSDQPQVRLHVADMLARTDCEPFTSSRAFDWGARDVRLVVSRCSPLDLVVVDASTQRPVERFGVRVIEDPDQCQPDHKLRHAGVHENGRVRIRGLPTGRSYVQVVSLDPRFESSWPLPIDVTPGGIGPQTVPLHAAVQRWLRVITEAGGRPIAGTHVELVREVRGQPITLTNYYAPLRRLLIPNGALSTPEQRERLRIPELVQAGVTGPDGRLRLRSAPANDLSIRLLGPGHIPTVVGAVAVADGLDELVVRVQRGATVRGWLRPPEAARWLGRGDVQPTVRLLPKDRNRTPLISEFANDGSYVVTGVAQGSWEVWLFTGWQSAKKCTTLDVRTNAEHRVDIETSGNVPGSVVGRVLVAGSPPAQCRVTAWNDKRRLDCVTDDSGSFEIRLLPEVYRFRFVVLDTNGKQISFYPYDQVQVVSGRAVQHTFHLSRVRLVVRVLTADGTKPAAGARFVLDVARASAGYRHFETDKNGELVLDPAPATPFHLVPVDGASASERRIGPLTIRTGQSTQTIEVRLPNPR